MRTLEKSGRKILPGIWQLNRTTFVVRVQPKDPRTGKKRNIRRVLEDSSRREAILVREELLASVHASASIPTNRETVGAFASWWLDHKKSRGDIQITTAEKYAVALDHLSPRILNSFLDEVTPTMIEAWMVKATRPKTGRKPERYAASTVNSWLRALRTMYVDACRLRGLTFNPATAVRSLVESHDLEDTNSLPADQLTAVLLELRKGDPALAMAAWTQAWTGMRWGEVSALKWSDLDEERRILLVRRKAQKGKLVPSTKTKRRRRTGVPEALLEGLLAYRAGLEKDSHPGLESGLMFPSSVGKPIWSSRISDALRAACARAGITQRFTSQGFRRSMTDLLREAAVDPVVAKAITGHSTDRMREHYSTVRAADLRAAGDAAAATMAPKLRLIEGGAAKESSEESSAGPETTSAGEDESSTGRNQ